MERALREAIEEGRLRALYQPIVSIVDGSINGVEAMLRYENDDGELVAPSEFLAVAEESGLVETMSDWILRDACHQAAKWRHNHGLARRAPIVAVNIAAVQASREDFPDTVSAALADAGLPATSLRLEVTEGALMETGSRSVANLEAVRSAGVRVGIDDFGTGYSSLARLKHLPVDFLKIDRSFVEGLGRDRDDLAIVETIMGLAEALGLRVVAEGVESTEQLTVLQSLHCHYAQGFYFAKPLAAHVVGTLLDAGGVLPSHLTP